MSNFIQDYLTYNQNNECPKNYHFWTAFSILASAVTRKLVVYQGYFRIRPNLYIGLIGTQGGRKTTAADIGREIFRKALPNHPIGNSTMSAQRIIEFMSSDECARAYTDHEGITIEYRPITLFVNEMKNFLSVNPAQTIAFLTDIYDRDFFDSGTIKRGLEAIYNPCVNFLGCETPDWIIENLKRSIISGGFARRIIYVYETEEPKRIPFPSITPEMEEARARCIAHLQKISTIAGVFEWEPEARKYYAHWYTTFKRSDDAIMQGFDSSRHVQVMKLAMLLAVAEYNPRLILTAANLDYAVKFIDVIAGNMPRLSIAAGRNELALPQQQLTEMIEAHGGLMPEKEVLRRGGKNLTPNELSMVLNHLVNSDQLERKIFKWPTPESPARVMLLIPGARLKPEVMAAMKAAGAY